VKGEDGKKGRDRISTKSGYERRVENNRRGAREASKKREKDDMLVIEEASSAGEEDAGFDGFDD
jgi:ATP-dependent RNA helicase DDX52/ROK1